MSDTNTIIPGWHPPFPDDMTVDFIAGLEHALELVADEQWYPSSIGYVENNNPLKRAMYRIEYSIQKVKEELR